MKLVVGQVREILEIPPETYRNWKRTLSPLKNRNGYCRCFSYGDLLALAIVSALTRDGWRIGAIARAADALFSLCDGLSWMAAERGVIVLDLPGGRVNFHDEVSEIAVGTGALIVLPGAPLIRLLQERLHDGQVVDPQIQIPYPPRVARR